MAMTVMFLFVAVFVLIVPLVALVVALDARGQVRRSEERLRGVETWLGRLQAEVRRPAAAPAVGPPAGEAQAPAVVQPVEAPAPPPPPVAVPAPAAPAVAVPPVAPPVVPAPVPVAAPVPAAKPSLEERIGITWFTRIGAAVLVLGAAYFFKYAVDNQWIGPWGRVALGALAGVAVLAAAEWMRPKARAAYVQGLVGVGLALLYVSGYAAYGFYDLLPMPAAFAALVVVAALAAALSIHHRSEVILVLALGAALANPLLLSTGHDRVLALGAYLLAVTTGVLVVAVRQRFATAAWLAVAGTALLAMSWSAKFFRIHPPAVDALDGRAIPGTAGAYFPIGPRLVPLGLAVAFAAQWVTTALAARRREWKAVGPTGLLLAGLLLAHLGTGWLLTDRPELLATAMAVCGLASVLLLRGEAQTPLLALPLVVSFLVLAGRGELARSHPVLMLVPVALWVGVYAVDMVRRARSTAGGRPSPQVAAVLTGSLVAAVVLCAQVLLPAHPQSLAVLLLPLAVGAAVLGQWTGRPAVLVTGAAATMVALLAANPQGASMPAGFLLLAAGWGAVYLLGGAHALLVRSAAPSPPLVLVTAAGPVGFVAVLLAGTARADSGLRALAAAGAGLALFALGVAVLRRREDARQGASALMGCGVGLVTLAVGLAFSGVTITLVWALMGLVVVLLAVREGDDRWLAGGVALLAVAFLRMLAVDVLEPARMAALFTSTLGAQGALEPTPLLNPRALALAGVALALLMAARLVSRGHPREVWAPMAVLGYVLLLALVISEVRLLVTSLPAFPGPGLARDEFFAFMGRVEVARAAQAARRGVSVTLALGGFGGLLLGAGFAARHALHRWLGLVVLAFTVAKLGLWDIWDLPRVYQILVLVAVGALLLGAGFLYARFGSRLLGLLRTGAAGMILLAAVGGVAEGVEPFRYRMAAPLTAPSAGPLSFVVPPELYRAAATGPRLDDVRIVAPDGREVPWFLRDVPAREPATELPTELLDPVTRADGSSRAVLDLGPGGGRHSEVELELQGESFLRLVVVEVSDDRAEWAVIGQGHVFAVTTPAGQASSSCVRYPTSAARFLRLSVAGAAGEPPVPVQGGHVRHRPPAAVEPTGEIELALVSREVDTQRRHTLLVADAGSGGVPLRALVLDVAEPRFERRVDLETGSREGVWAPAGCGLVFRAGDESGLRIPLPTDKRLVRLAVRDGDDPPLTVRSIRGEYRLQEIVLEAPAAGTLTLVVGRDDGRAPEYDLAALPGRVRGLTPGTAVLGRLAPNPRYRPAGDSGSAPWTERHRLLIGIALGLLALALAWWTWRLLR